MTRRPSPPPADLAIGQVVSIADGPFAGYDGVVVKVEGGEVVARVTLYGKTGLVTLQRDQLELPESDPRPRLLEELQADVREALQEGLLDFWRQRLARGGELLADWDEFAAFRDRERATWEQEGRSRTQAFLEIYSDHALAMEGADALRRKWAAERARWVPEAVKRQEKRQLAQARADELGGLAGQQLLVEELEAEAARAQAAQERWDRAEYLDFRRSALPPRRALEELRAAGRKAADALQAALAVRLERSHGLTLPGHFFTFWAFLRGLSPAERDALDELLGFGLGGWLACLETQGRLPEGSPWLFDRQYRDPPELVPTFTFAGGAVRVGLWYDDPSLPPSFAAAYAPEEPLGELYASGHTLLEALRHQLELTASRAPAAPADAGALRGQLGLSLLREAICELETSSWAERGTAYLRRRELHLPGRLPTVHGLGVLSGGEALPRRNLGLIREAIAGDTPEVRVWAQLALDACVDGRAADALALGQDLHWLSGGNLHREALAAKLLEAAYVKLGRPALLEAVRSRRAAPAPAARPA